MWCCPSWPLPGTAAPENDALSDFIVSMSACMVVILPVRPSISLARSAIVGSDMALGWEVAEVGAAVWLVVVVGTTDGEAVVDAVEKLEDSDRRDRDTKLSTALLSRVGGPRLRRS